MNKVIPVSSIGFPGIKQGGRPRLNFCHKPIAFPLPKFSISPAKISYFPLDNIISIGYVLLCEFLPKIFFIAFKKKKKGNFKVSVKS